MDTKLKESRPDWIGFRYLSIFFEAAHARYALAYGRPAATLFEGDKAKKRKALRKRLKRFRKHHPKHPLVKLSNSPKLDVLDLAILYVLVRNTLRITVDAWQRTTPTPYWLLLGAGAPSAHDAMEQVHRLADDAPLRKLKLVASHSKSSQPLLTTHFHPAPKALRLAFGDTPACRTLVAKLPAAPREVSQSDASAELLVWPEGLSRQMDRVVHGARTRKQLLARAGLLDRLPSGRGIHVLMSGPPGTGKTLAARTLAKRLERPLRLLHGPDIQSMWVGEAEKAVREMYRAAQKDKVVLCVDEIDALIIDRNDARQSWERSLVDAFLVEMEAFEGVAVYTTNRPAALDAALERRLTFRLEVPRPGPRERLRIWKAHLPDAVPLAKNVCLTWFAEQDLSGGEICNAVLAALTEASMREPLEVTSADLRAGIRTATQGRWTKGVRPPVGFGR